MTFLVKSATTGSSSIQSKPRSDEEILSIVQDIKIQRVLTENFGKEEGLKLFKIYKKEEPAPLKWKKQRKIVTIPHEFIGAEQKLKSSEVLHLPNGKKLFLVSYDFIENNEGKWEFWEKLEPLTQTKFLEQKWLQNYKNKWLKRDGDLISQKFGLDLHCHQAFKPKRVAEIKETPSFGERIIQKIAQIAKRILRFFQKLCGFSPKNSWEPFPTISFPIHKKETKIIISSSNKSEEEMDYLDFFET